jgi:pimeloyl-ACP methyl ester carboxylesterase/membrane protein DedA with SNARE-associated domain
LAALLICTPIRLLQPDTFNPQRGEKAVMVQQVRVQGRTPLRLPQETRFAYIDTSTGQNDTRPVLVMLHGSPGGSDNFDIIAPMLSAYRLIIPDLPGFGQSGKSIPDYSVRAHADYTWQLLDQLGIEKAHLFAYSMGGGVALDMADLAPHRVQSIIMYAAIGAQEYELLGDYHLNHAVHGAQLVFFGALDWLIPHTNRWDMLWSYTRNFYDTDQRPLHDILLAYQSPMLIVQGTEDTQVPLAAAMEHARLVPHSELVLLPIGHGMIFNETESAQLAELSDAFLQKVEAGTAQTRADVTPAQEQNAHRALSTDELMKFTGISAFVLILLLIVIAFVSEDLACIGAGLLVAQGRVEFLPAAIGAGLGVFFSDWAVLWLAHTFGKRALRLPPLRWWVKAEQVQAMQNLVQNKGAWMVFVARAMAGTRVVTHTAIGLFNRRYWWFVLLLLVAGVPWGFAFVAASAWLGNTLFGEALRQYFWQAVLTFVLILWLLTRTLPLLFSHKSRREWLGWWGRLTRWEFWPMWAFYPPVMARIVWLGLRHGGLNVFTAANPAMPAGGLVGESKSAILQGLAGAGESVAHWRLLPAGLSVEERLSLAQQAQQAWLDQFGTPLFPVVCKPDVGERGAGAAILRTAEQLNAYLASYSQATILQAYVPGCEFGVFYVRYPDRVQGQIFAVTEKQFPCVVGDGKRTLEQLILDDTRAVYMTNYYHQVNAPRLQVILPKGESLQLVEIGAHSRGTLFLDGTHWVTPDLTAAIDRISQTYVGFYFGRYDVRAKDLAAFQAGDVQVIELNGVSSEATNIYDPQYKVWQAWNILFRQWQIAFEIGAENIRRGAKPTPYRELLRLIFGRA